MNLCNSHCRIHNTDSFGMMTCNLKIAFANPPVKYNVFEFQTVCLICAPVSRQAGLNVKIKEDSKIGPQATRCQTVERLDHNQVYAPGVALVGNCSIAESVRYNDLVFIKCRHYLFGQMLRAICIIKQKFSNGRHLTMIGKK